MLFEFLKHMKDEEIVELGYTILHVLEVIVIVLIFVVLFISLTRF